MLPMTAQLYAVRASAVNERQANRIPMLFSPTMNQAGGDGHDLQSQKTLSRQSLRKFNFHTFATIWLALYLG